MDTIRFAYISLECARIRPHRHASSVDIWLVHRQSIKFKANSLFSFKSIVIVVEMYVLTINSLTSEIITIVLILCSEIIRQKSPIVSSSGSCVMMNDSELS